MAAVNGSLTFLAREPHHEEVRLYELEYEPTDGFPEYNCGVEEIKEIPINDIRPVKETLSLDEQGFIVSYFPSSLDYEDFWDEESLKTKYLPELRDHLMPLLGARALYFHECVIRKRHEEFPLKTNATKGYGQPIPFVHMDYTLREVSNLVQQLCGDRSKEVLEHRYQILNVWKPLRGPLQDWPLAFCDLKTIDVEDVKTLDEVHPTIVLESGLVYYNPTQKWCYLSNQEPTELLIFKTVDSEVLGSVPHGAFQLPECPKDELPRESLELRCLVVY